MKKLFSQNFENELYQSLEKQLLANQQPINKMAKVKEYLIKSASIFQNAGMEEISQEIEKVLSGVK